MTATDTPDLAHVAVFLDYLASKQPEAAQFAHLLLDDGAAVLDIWGPQQMDVWHLDLRRGDWIVRFHIERGIAEWARVARAMVPPLPWDSYQWIGLAIFAWARATGVPFRLTDPDDIWHDLEAHGRAALDWLNEGNHQTLDRVDAVWMGYQRARLGLQNTTILNGLQVEWVTAMEAAVAT